MTQTHTHTYIQVRQYVSASSLTVRIPAAPLGVKSFVLKTLEQTARRARAVQGGGVGNHALRWREKGGTMTSSSLIQLKDK